MVGSRLSSIISGKGLQPGTDQNRSALWLRGETDDSHRRNNSPPEFLYSTAIKKSFSNPPDSSPAEPPPPHPHAHGPVNIEREQAFMYSCLLWEQFQLNDGSGSSWESCSLFSTQDVTLQTNRGQHFPRASGSPPVPDAHAQLRRSPSFGA